MRILLSHQIDYFPVGSCFIRCKLLRKMKSLSRVGLGLSIVFGCLLLALVAELYYLLWRKKRFARRGLGESDHNSDLAKEFLFMFCWRKPSALSHPVVETDSLSQDPHASNKDLVFKPFGDDGDCSIETELMRLHNISGPPRFLFTIMEETKEDLESEDGKSRSDSNRSRVQSRGRSLSDLLMTAETPYLTPIASPSLFSTPPDLTPVKSSSCQQAGFNPLFESSADAEFNRMRSSPPPKFKFLQHAEEKLQRRKMVEEAEKKSGGDGEDGSFISIVVDKNKERGFSHHHHHQFHSATSQVLPLSSSPSTFR